ncbi:coil containing protein [Vibrio phage vB_VcM_SY]
MKEVIAKLERILELTSTHGITLQPENKPATSEDQLMYVESKIRLNAIQALDIFDKNNIERQKPRTKTEFVKVGCEWAVWEYLKAFSELSDDVQWLIKVSDDQYTPIHDWFNIAETLRKHNLIYRKVETEIDERQEFIDAYRSEARKLPFVSVEEFAGSIYDSGKFKLVEK